MADNTVLTSSKDSISMNQQRSGQLLALPGPAMVAQVSTANLKVVRASIEPSASPSNSRTHKSFSPSLRRGPSKICHSKATIPTHTGSKRMLTSLGCSDGTSLNKDTVSPNSTVVDTRIRMYTASTPITVASQGISADLASSAAA